MTTPTAGGQRGYRTRL